MAAPLALAPERQAELRALAAANLAAERPPYAWVRLSGADVAWLISEHGWVTSDEPGPRVDLRRANLVGADLHGMTLRQARFEGAVLVDADLREIDAFFAHFTDADLRRARLDGAQMDMARMRGARLAGAHLTGTHLRQCWLPEADLSGAQMDGADLALAQLDHIDLHEASLVGARFTGARMAEGDLRAAKLAGADLSSAQLERAQLDGADLHGAHLAGAWCDGASLFGADLRGADLRGARFSGAQMSEALLAGARLGALDLTGVDLTRIGDLPMLISQPMGDESAARQERDPAQRSDALRTAATGLLRLHAALAATGAVEAATLRRLRARAARLHRQALRNVPRGTWRALGASAAYLFWGDGNAPGRVALWGLALVAAMTALLWGTGTAHDGTSALALAASGFTSAGVGYVAAHTSGAMTLVGIAESLLGDGIIAGFIAAVVRRAGS